MNEKMKWLLPLGIVVATALIAYLIVSNPPQSRRGGPSTAPQLTVNVDRLVPRRYTVVVDSYGTLAPSTESALVSQVSGQIEWVSPNFRNGGFFSRGDVLLRIDQRDYQANVKIAEADLLAAEQALLEEQANARQAEIDWQRLGDGRAPSDLVLRKPQLASARARLLSAEAGLTRAQLSLERTEITAPYDGRIKQQLVDFGQVIPANSTVAEIYSTDSVEIRLPINNSDIELIQFPEQDREGRAADIPIDVRLTSSLSSDQSWMGALVRTEGAIDTASQQLFVVARIDEPYNSERHPGPSIKIGQYVSAEIEGKTLDDVLVIDNNAIYQGSYVYIVVDGLLLRRDIRIRWQNDLQAIIDRGLEPGDILVTTPLGQVSSGTRVMIAGEQVPPGEISDVLDADREARLRNRAEELGITVEQLRAQRRGSGPRPGPADQQGDPVGDES